MTDDMLRAAGIEPFTLNEAEAARALRISRAVLMRMRLRGEAPPHVVICEDSMGRERVRYPADRLRAWIAGRTVAGGLAPTPVRRIVPADPGGPRPNRRRNRAAIDAIAKD